jgi:hypothetical protein
MKEYILARTKILARSKMIVSRTSCWRAATVISLDSTLGGSETKSDKNKKSFWFQTK